MSIELNNFTPFPNLRFSGLDKDKKEFGVFMVKTAWDIPAEDAACQRSDEQEPFVFTDEYHGEINETAVRYPSDFVPYKPKTDFIVNATAFAPGGKPVARWLVGFQVKNEAGEIVLEKTLQITGPRFWVPKWKRKLSGEEQENWQKHRELFEGWELSEPEPIDRLPIRYEYAFGGSTAKGEDENGEPVIEAFENNPIGIGMLDPDWSDLTQPHPAPQIEDPNNPVTEPYKLYSPEGFGPVPPAWQPRRRLGGTYDQHWLDHVHPDWPKDYDFEFHNSSHQALRAPKHVKGKLSIQLINLHPEKEHWHFTLLDEGVVAAVEDEENITFTDMNRDTVFLEIDEHNLADPRLFSLWRMPFHQWNTMKLSLMTYSPDKREQYEEFFRVEAPHHPESISDIRETAES